MSPAFPVITGAFPATAAERGLQEYIDAGDVGVLEVVQQAAREWAAALAGLTGVLGILSVVQGGSAVPDLTEPLQLLVGALLALAVISATAALLLAALAAQGFPDLGPLTPIAVAMAALRSRVVAEKDKAIRRLTLSRVLAAVTVGLVLAAVGITWYGETEDRLPPPPRLIVRTIDRVECGTLAPAPVGFVTVVPDGPDGPATIMVDKIREVMLVDRCPAAGPG